MGRFGNQLFQIASTIGIARKHGYDFGFPKWMNYDHKETFGSNEDCDLQKYFVNPLPIQEGGALPQHTIVWGYRDEYVPDNVSIWGHMQSEKYFKHCIDEVRHYFKMRAEASCNNYSEYTALHIRRGDYDDRYHPRIRFDYYLGAMRALNNPPVVIFSDDPQTANDLWMHLRINECPYVYTHGGVNYLDDFIHMKQCKNFITANSSFSLMAAILSEAPDKKIICPSNWFGEAWGSGYKEMSKDVYPEGAIII